MAAKGAQRRNRAAARSRRGKKQRAAEPVVVVGPLRRLAGFPDLRTWAGKRDEELAEGACVLPSEERGVNAT